MTPTPPSATSSHSGNSPDASYRVVRKRNRVPLSCAPCRHRKLKCNRGQPCDNCTKRGDSSSCTYAAPAARKKGSQTHGSISSGNPDDMQNRIDRLEGLVLSLMTNGEGSAGPQAAQAVMSAGVSMSSGSLGQNLDADLEESQMLDGGQEGEGYESDTEKVTKSFGVMKVDAENKKTFYIGEAHWAALLNDISEVRNHFQSHKKEYEAQMHKVAQTRRDTKDNSGPALLFGATKPPSREEIMSQVPSRYMTDMAIARYFNTFDPSTHILHGPTFQKQYNQHWLDPSKTSMVWIAMLFAMMRLAMISWSRDGDEPPEFHGKCNDLSTTYRTQMAHCLILADYTKPHSHLIETLIFHLHGEYTSNRDAEASVWVLIGMIARLAMRMGFHRDSKYFPNISPFQGEMRRRIWTFVRQADLLFSFQIALPSLVRIGDSDTELPSNIYDDEFDEDCTALPPARPPSEATPVSYMIAKARLAFGFGRVLEEINGVQHKPYDEVLKIDRGLRDIYASIPEHLKLRPMAEQTLAPISLIMARFGLASLYHKALCVLHRRFLKASQTSLRYLHSRKTCLDSAMILLSFQHTQHAETRDRGRMRSMRAYINSLTTHDFLLAATIVCMDLYYNRETADWAEGSSGTPNTSVSGGSGSRGSGSHDPGYGPNIGHRREELFAMLERSRDIWREMNDQSMEAYKASEVLDMLLGKLRVPYKDGVRDVGGANQPPGFPFPNGNSAGREMDEQNAAMTLGLLSSGGVSPNAQARGQGQQQQPQRPGAVLDSKYAFESIFPSVNYVAGQTRQQQKEPYGGTFGGALGAADGANAMSGFGNVFADPNDGNEMALDWDAWDNYMQPPNVGIDPAANLWGNPSSSNLFSSMSSPGGSGNNMYQGSDLNAILNTDKDMAPPSMPGGPQLSAASPNNGGYGSNDASAGEVFMGVSSPQAGGLPSWKWNEPNISRQG